MTPQEMQQVQAMIAQAMQQSNQGDGAFNPKASDKDFFWYATQVPTIAAAAIAQTTIQIDTDADFYWIATSYQASIAGGALTEATNVIPLVNLLINDGGSGRNFSNITMPLGAWAGDGKRPYRLIRPRVIGGGSTLQFNWVNFSAATTYAPLTFIMHGYKKYLNVR